MRLLTRLTLVGESSSDELEELSDPVPELELELDSSSDIFFRSKQKQKWKILENFSSRITRQKSMSFSLLILHEQTTN
jgi:hypothetical protein